MNSFVKLVLGSVFLVGCAGAKPRPVNIAEAKLPYMVVRAKDGATVDKETFIREVADAQAVCLGESHDNPHHHWVQLHVVDEASRSGGDRALGLEMFQRPFQGPLDDYASKRISAKQFLTLVGWKSRWGFDFGFYRPTVDLAAERGFKLLALNVSNELRKKISKDGFDSLTPAERQRVVELDLDNQEHRAWFDSVMAGHAEAVKSRKKKKGEVGEGQTPKPAPSHPPHQAAEPHGHKVSPGHGKDHKAAAPDGHKMPPSHGKDHKAAASDGHTVPPSHGKDHEAAASDGHSVPPGPHGEPSPKPTDSSDDRIYAIQVLWDETMADTAAKWLAAAPNRKVFILAGTGHCHDSAIVARLKRRGIERVLSVRPVVDDGKGNVSKLLAEPINDFIVVMTRDE
jgi:uncharacterized iron-regulated protein